MGDRDCVSDRWLQHNATMPGDAAIEKYRKELRLFVEREKAHPRAPMNIRQAFKSDPVVVEMANKVFQENGRRGVSDASVAKSEDRMFIEAENSPGRLDQYQHVVEKDL